MIAAAVALVASLPISAQAIAPPVAVFKEACLPFVRDGAPEAGLERHLSLQRDTGLPLLTAPFAWEHWYRAPGVAGRLDLSATQGGRSCSFDFPEPAGRSGSPLSAALGSGWRFWVRPSPTDGAANPIFCASHGKLHASFTRAGRRGFSRNAGLSINDYPRDSLCDGPP